MTNNSVVEKPIHFSAALNAQGTVRQQLEKVAQQLEGMPTTNSPSIPQLSKHIGTVKEHARYYLNDLSSIMNQFYQEVESYGTLLNSEASNLTTILKQDTPDARAIAQKSLQGLLQAGQPIESSLQNLNTTIGTFDDQISSDARNFSSDVALANSNLASEQEALRNLKAKEASYKKELASKKRNEIIVGIFTLGIGAAIMELTRYIESTEDDIRRTHNEENTTRQQINQLSAAISSVTSFSRGTAMLSGLTINLQKDWQTVDAGLQEVTQHDVSTSFLLASIKSIQADWQQVVAETRHLEN